MPLRALEFGRLRVAMLRRDRRPRNHRNQNPRTNVDFLLWRAKYARLCAGFGVEWVRAASLRAAEIRHPPSH